MSDCPNCSDGYVEVDDMMVLCPQCSGTVTVNGTVLRYDWSETIDHMPALAHKDAVLLQPTGDDDDDDADDTDDEHPIHVIESAQRYVYQLADLMGLRGWDFKVSEEHASDHTLAEIETVYGQLAATVWLGETWEELSPEMKRDTLVHELVHAHMARVKHLVDDIFKAAGKKVAAIGGAAWHLEEEYTVEAISQAWAPWLPVPFDGEAGA